MLTSLIHACEAHSKQESNIKRYASQASNLPFEYLTPALPISERHFAGMGTILVILVHPGPHLDSHMMNAQPVESQTKLSCQSSALPFTPVP